MHIVHIVCVTKICVNIILIIYKNHVDIILKFKARALTIYIVIFCSAKSHRSYTHKNCKPIAKNKKKLIILY